jgi:hypothetical protein
LVSAWDRWRKAEAGLNRKGMEEAQVQLLGFREELGIGDLDAFSVGFSRAADRRLSASDAAAAVDDAQSAVSLAPDLPFAHLGLAHAYFGADATEIPRYLKELIAGLQRLWTHPRYGRTELADLGAALLFAVLSTAAAVVLVLFLKGARYFLHDFHHLFPRSAAPWQTTALALLLLSVPVVGHIGVVPVLLVLFAASTLYLR